MSIIEKYYQRIETSQSLLCVGLDSRLDRLPAQFLSHETPQFAFNRWIIDKTHPYVVAYKPNTAFYEARGAQGWHELQLTMNYLREQHPSIFTICDAKRSDIGSTNEGYVEAIFDTLGFDAITLQPYLGREALRPFLDRADKASIILCRTSNPGAGELQDLIVHGQPLWKHIARSVSSEWNTHQNCMLVVGATAPDQLKQVRDIVGSMPLLVPGIGAQGGDLKAVMKAGECSIGDGLIINSSRGIIFADDPAAAAQELSKRINFYRQTTDD